MKTANSKALLALLILGSLTACNQDGKKASALLEEAQSAYLAGDYDLSFELLDSIKTAYPKAYDVRHQANDLSYEVETSVQRKNIQMLESLRDSLEARITQIQEGLKLEKDAQYQSLGNYMAESQVVEKNIHRSYLRFQVREDGQMTLTSIYSGSSNIHHTKVKVSAPDGTSATTPDSKDSYESEDLGIKSEKADYKLGEDGGVIEFCAQNADRKSLTLEFLGDRNYKTTMTQADLQAAARLLELSRLSANREQVLGDIEESQTKIQFIEKLKIQKAENSQKEE